MDKTSAARPQIIQVVGYKNTGKTTMTATLIAGFAAKGLKVAAIKHDGHDHFEIDQEGTDSYQFGKAGASAVVVMSKNRTAIMKQHNTRLEEMLNQLSDYDWIVIEGFKDAPYPKLVMVREALDLTLVRELQQVVGIVFWSPKLLEEAAAEVLVERDTNANTDLDANTNKEVDTGLGSVRTKGETNPHNKTEAEAEAEAKTEAEAEAVTVETETESGREKKLPRFLFQEQEVIVNAVLRLSETTM